MAKILLDWAGGSHSSSVSCPGGGEDEELRSGTTKLFQVCGQTGMWLGCFGSVKSQSEETDLSTKAAVLPFPEKVDVV